MSVCLSCSPCSRSDPSPLTIDERGAVIVDARVTRRPLQVHRRYGRVPVHRADDLATELGAPVVAKSEVVGSAGSDMRFVVGLAGGCGFCRVRRAARRGRAAASLSRLGRGVRGLRGQISVGVQLYTPTIGGARLTWDEA